MGIGSLLWGGIWVETGTLGGGVGGHSIVYALSDKERALAVLSWKGIWYDPHSGWLPKGRSAAALVHEIVVWAAVRVRAHQVASPIRARADDLLK